MFNISSPCIQVCRLRNGACIGCYRTKEEITAWSSYSDEEKHNVNLLVEKRKQ